MSEHREYRIYDDCGHDHREGDPGTCEVDDVGVCCEEGYMYSVCWACHTHDGEMHEHSPEEQAWPCDAAKASVRIEELEEAVRTLLYRHDLVPNADGSPCRCAYCLYGEMGILRRALAGKEKSGG